MTTQTDIEMTILPDSYVQKYGYLLDELNFTDLYVTFNDSYHWYYCFNISLFGVTYHIGCVMKGLTH